MTIEELRFYLTGKKKILSILSGYENMMLLVSPYIENRNLSDSMDKIYDDIELKPEIPKTSDKRELKFLKYDYDEKLYQKSEVLSFLYASINPEWDVIKGTRKSTGKPHFYLKHENYVYDPSLAIVTSEEMYDKEFKDEETISNKDIEEYLEENNNLYPYYKRKSIPSFFRKDKSFSIKFVQDFKKKFQEKIEEQYEFPEDMDELRNYYGMDSFRQIRQILTRKRVWELESNEILLHPDVNPEILDQIERETTDITKKMEGKFPGKTSYHNGTIGNCYGLSIMYNIYNGDFKLVQGGIPYEKSYEFFPNKKDKKFFQHSWLEKDDIVYDPSLRMVVPKELYYKIFEKRDVYTKEATKAMLKRVGCNLTYFSDFLRGRQIGNDETLLYRTRSIDTPERREEGEKLIRDIEG